MPHTADELREYADEHVLYEIWMTADLTARMSRHAEMFRQGVSESDGRFASELLDLAGRNADIESWATHVRNLLKFLYMKRPTQADVVAAEYFEKVHDWTGIRPDRPDSLGRVNARVPVEIGHLSFGRLGLSEEEKSWPYQQMWRELASVVDVFVSAVPDGSISQTFRTQAKALLSGYRPEGIRELVTKMGRDSIRHGSGVTHTSTDYSVSDFEPGAGTATALSLPKCEPPIHG